LKKNKRIEQLENELFLQEVKYELGIFEKDFYNSRIRQVNKDVKEAIIKSDFILLFGETNTSCVANDLVKKYGYERVVNGIKTLYKRNKKIFN